tara:strand:- start:2235 stop:4253 length:2019 start_codon:yes stop_codon:yes gene_type:complete
MWTLDNLPKSQFKSRYAFEATSDWTKHVQLSSVRLANGCSGSFISKDGLVMTNHHCARGCIQNLSDKKNDAVSNGFFAKKRSQEKTCPAFEINRLVNVSDVTDEMLKATKGKTDKSYSDAKKEKMAELEKVCATDAKTFRCDTVSLYNGGQYKMYKYRRYSDVRLVFAPEDKIASFGGDPDNFNFPRYSLDMTLLRVYENDKPLDNKNWFSWAEKGVQKGDMTFITGHPGRTSRLEPISVIEYTRDTQLVKSLIRLSEMRGLLDQFAKKDKESARISKSYLKGVENGFKALSGRLKALQDKKFFASLKKKETDLRYRVNSNRWYKKKYGDAWDKIAQALKTQKDLSDELTHIAYSNYGSRLFGLARSLVRYADEAGKPNGKRLREYTESKIPRLKQQLFSPAPIYKSLETTMMEFNLTKLREHLSPDHSFTKLILGKKSPNELASEMVRGSKLKDIKYRKKLFEGGKKAIMASKDPMIRLALKLDKEARRVRKIDEDEISPILSKNKEKIAQALFKIYGTDNYPDATFSLRLSYGKVKGFPEKGKFIEPTTQVAGVYVRQTGREPFKLPKKWITAEKKLRPKTSFNFTSTNDIIGGNSGSPVINRKAEIVGLVFDGNIHSLGGAYGFDETQNRAISVHSDLILESLEKVYGAGVLVKEIKNSRQSNKKLSSL